MSGTTVRLGAKGSKLAHKGRPWFYADDLADRLPETPGLARVLDDKGRDLGLGVVSPHSRLALRLAGGWPGDAVPAPEEFFDSRLAAALARRSHLLGPAEGSRIVHGEADALPGLVVDRYADVVVVQVGSAGLEPFTAELVAALDAKLAPRMVLARHDTAVRRLEKLPEEIRLLSGRRVEEVEIEEGGLRHPVRPWTGHKTGFYLDQRPARAFVGRHARGRRVLDVFSYQGGFALSALHGGAASALAIDQSADALAAAAAAAERNGLVGLETCGDNAFTKLRDLRRAGEQFDLVVVDPPAFAKNRRELQGALRGYRDLNRLALRLLGPGGLLVTCSCSHHMSPVRFEETLRHAAAELPFRTLLRARIGAGEDHPVWLALPESEYLKVLVAERGD